MASSYSENESEASLANRLPNHDEHCAQSLKRYGRSFSELHTWMDEPCAILGSNHRKYRHDPFVTPSEAKALFGDFADHACLDHIRLDELESRKSCDEIKRLQVVKFTIQTSAGTWQFESEGVSISKDGKTRFFLRSSNLSQKPIHESKEVDDAIEEEEDGNDEDEEWWKDEDDPEGSEP
jgi:hypothetical protein